MRYRKYSAMVLIVAVFCGISMLFGAENTCAETYKEQGSEKAWSEDFFERLAQRAAREAEKKLRLKNDYALLFHHATSGGLVAKDGQFDPSLYYEWVDATLDEAHRDVKKSFGYALRFEIHENKLFQKTKLWIRDMTRIAVHNDAPQSRNNNLRTIASDQEAKKIELLIDRYTDRLKFIGDVNSPEGFEQRIRLEYDLGLQKYLLEHYYRFMVRVSAETNIKKEPDDIVFHVSPYVGTSWRHLELKSFYRLRNKTHSGTSGFEWDLSWHALPEVSLFMHYALADGTIAASAHTTFSSSLLSAKYSRNRNGAHDITAEYTKILGNNVSFTASGQSTIKSDAGYFPEYRFSGLVNYRF